MPASTKPQTFYRWVDEHGTVLAKGTFNNLAQLESVLATAGRRRAGVPHGAVTAGG